MEVMEPGRRQRVRMPTSSISAACLALQFLLLGAPISEMAGGGGGGGQFGGGLRLVSAGQRPEDQFLSTLPQMDTIDHEIQVDVQDGCTPDPKEHLFVVHWTHVPKAGGTTFAELSKQIACVMNPHIAAINPCCRKDLCLAPTISCHASASSCPLVTGIGRHASNMDRMMGVPCCGAGWSMTSVQFGFMAYALKGDIKSRLAQKTRDIICRHIGLPTAAPAKFFLMFMNTPFIGDNNWKESQYKMWTMTDRIKFLSQLGTPPNRISDRLKQMKPPLDTSEIERLEELAKSIEPPFATQREMNMHILRCTQRMMKGECCGVESGSNSLSMIRHPFARAVSGYFYRGHNPNYDVFALRPKYFHTPRDPGARKHGQHPGKYSFSEFTEFSEYANVLTKMFGASKNCDQVVKCHKSAWSEGKKHGGACLLTTGCHAYRNSSFLQPLHLSQAVRALDQHKFVGLVEAYNSSILLIADIFGLNLTESDFAHARPNPSLSEVCNSLNVRKHRTSKKACLRSMEVNKFDAELYEHTHRSFCRNLEDRGLRSHPKVVAEVTRGKLCGDLDFSDPEAYCSHISPQKDLDRIEADQIRCKTKGSNH